MTTRPSRVGLGRLTPDQATNSAPPLASVLPCALGEGRDLATPLPILPTVTSATMERLVFRCGHLSLDDDGDRVRRSVHRSRRAGVRGVRDRGRILAGEAKENTMDDKRARELVARERARIEQSLRELNADVTAEEELHQQQTGEASEAGTDLDREEIDIALVADLREELKAVGRAEARIAAGKYGWSIDSGAQIPDERLEAAPLAERTIEEQRRLETGVR